MENLCKEINWIDIPTDVLFQGYLWLSNETKPILLIDDTCNHSYFKDLPFVVEGNLWDAKQQFSYKIKYIDGNYHVWRFDLKESSNKKEQFHSYNIFCHDIPGFRYFKVKEYWAEEQDPLLENMKTLVPAWTAFYGFKND